MNYMSNRDNAHDVDIFPDEKITKRSEPTNQVQTKIDIAKRFSNLFKWFKKLSYHLSSA